MDSGVERTQKIVITVSIILGIIIIFIIGYSLWNKATSAESQLAAKEALDAQTTRTGAKANVSLTGEAANTSAFTYDNLVKTKTTNNEATTSNIQIVNETVPTEVPKEETPKEEDTPAPAPKVVKKVARPIVSDIDRPLTADEIRQIRALPVDNSPSGSLQKTLETESKGEYKAQIQY